MTTTAADLYRAYPDSDLLPMEIDGVPKSADCGDTLYLFLYRELYSSDDPIDDDERVRRIDRAFHDLAAVRTGIRNHQKQEPTP